MASREGQSPDYGGSTAGDIVRRREPPAGEEMPDFVRLNSSSNPLGFRFPLRDQRDDYVPQIPASQPPPGLSTRGIPRYMESLEVTPHSSADYPEMATPSPQIPAREAREIPFQDCNVLFVVNGCTPQHRGLKNFARQLLSSRTSSAAPPVTRMVFWNEAFNQYVVQEITINDGNLYYDVGDVGSVRDLSRLLPIQHEADLIIIFTARNATSRSRRSSLGIERFMSDSLRVIPHIVVMVNENLNKPSPKVAFAAARRFTNMRHVAILYQAVSRRDFLGSCHILHIDGCLHTLRARGHFSGANISDLVEWGDLSELDLGAALERLMLIQNPFGCSGSTGREGTIQSPTETTVGDRTERRNVTPTDSPLQRTPLNSPNINTAIRVRHISEMFNIQSRPPTLTRLQRELRFEHQRNSRANIVAQASGWIPWERPFTPLPFPQPHPSSVLPQSDCFRGECQLCCEEDSQLVFLLKQSVTPLPDYRPVAWPFAVGAEPENDIISAFMCCDNCSFYVVDQGHTPIRETATGAFSLIPYTDNIERWKDDLFKGFSHYGHLSRDLLPLVFLAVIEETLRTKSWAHRDGSRENDLRHNALLWTKRQILTHVRISHDGHSSFLGQWIHAVVVQPRCDYKSIIWKYPLPGFRFMVRLADEYHQFTSSSILGHILWKRLALEVAQHFRALLTSSSIEVVTAQIIRVNDMLLRKDADWIEPVIAEGVVPVGVLDTLEGMRWVQENCRYALVLWLSWMPGLAGLVAASAAEAVMILVEERCGDVVIETPEEVVREWCNDL